MEGVWIENCIAIPDSFLIRRYAPWRAYGLKIYTLLCDVLMSLLRPMEGVWIENDCYWFLFMERKATPHGGAYGLKSKVSSRSLLVLCQDLVQVKMRNFSHFNPPEAQPQCVFFYTIVRIHLVTYSYNGYEFVSYCRKLPDIRKSNGMPACNREF